MKYIFLLFVFFNFTFAKDYLYLLPKDSSKALNHIQTLIKSSKSSIDIAMYNIKYKKLTKLLKKVKNDGVDINIVYDKGDNLEGLKTKKLKQKLHTKLAIFDKKIAVFGSSNWTKESFKNNYEVIYITDDKKLVNKFNKFFEEL